MRFDISMNDMVVMQPSHSARKLKSDCKFLLTTT